jgi:predicted nucleic acid-binding protein
LEVNGIVIDTNGYVAFARGDQDAIDLLKIAPILAMSATVLGEIFSGIAIGSKPTENYRRLQAFLTRPRVIRLNVDESTASVYPSISTTLRRIGRPIPTNDIWIAASALQHGFDLFSLDAHFRDVPGLRVGVRMTDFP